MPHLIWLTNIPTPYRNHRYELMRDILPQHGITFEVFYMAHTEPGRPWRFSDSELRYPHRFFGGITPSIRGVRLYTNPGLLSSLRATDPDILVTGGYFAPTLWAAPMLAPRAVQVLGVESNASSSTRNRGIAAWVKARAVRRSDAFVIPGEASREFLASLSPDATDKPVIKLPNIVDPNWSTWRISDERRREVRESAGAGPAEQLWVTAARLIPIKGLENLVLATEGLSGVRLAIAGDGEQRELLTNLIAERRLPVRLLGQLSEDSMRDLYASADVFILPSENEPYGLAAVEAAASGLPLILSKQVGAAPDLIIEGVNGRTFDAFDPPQLTSVLQQLASLSAQSLATMGDESRAMYRRNFDSVAAIENLAAQLAELVGTKDRS